MNLRYKTDHAMINQPLKESTSDNLLLKWYAESEVWQRHDNHDTRASEDANGARVTTMVRLMGSLRLGRKVVQ